MTRVTVPFSSDAELASIFTNVKELARIKEKEIQEIILSFKRACAHPLSQVSSRGPPLHGPIFVYTVPDEPISFRMLLLANWHGT